MGIREGGPRNDNVPLDDMRITPYEPECLERVDAIEAFRGVNLELAMEVNPDLLEDHEFLTHLQAKLFSFDLGWEACLKYINDRAQ